MDTLIHDLVLAVHSTVMPSLIPPQALFLTVFIMKPLIVRHPPLLTTRILHNTSCFACKGPSFLGHVIYSIQDSPFPPSPSGYALLSDTEVILLSQEDSSFSLIPIDILTFYFHVIFSVRECFDMLLPEIVFPLL